MRTEWTTAGSTIDRCWKRYHVSEYNIIRSFIICNLHNILLGWLNEWGCKIFSTNRRDKKCMQSFSWKNLKEKVLSSRCWWEENIKTDLKGTESEGNHVAQERNQWKALVNMVNDIQIPNKTENSVASWSNTGFSQRPLLNLHKLLIR
jgi:hypothetical protein